MIGANARTLASALAASLILAVGCALPEQYTKETFVMGTKAWVTIDGMGKRDAELAAEAALREMYRVESVMSNWRPQSEISRLNAQSNGRAFTASRELYALVDSSLFYARITSGAFDVTIRPLVLLWGFEGGEAKLPSEEEISRTMARVGFAKVVLNSSTSTVTLPPGMQIDLAGVAKGYAVDRCVAVLENLGVRSALVNIGGNIYALGSPHGESGWKIGIRDPTGGTGTVGTLVLRDAAVATSGNYENFVEIGGERYGHLIDPRTGRPISNLLSATVVAPTGLASDALSTGFFILGPEHAAGAIAGLRGVKALFALPRGHGVSYETVGDFGGALTLER
jgi:thiamine biosynthesis lipoprotein